MNIYLQNSKLFFQTSSSGVITPDDPTIPDEPSTGVVLKSYIKKTSNNSNAYFVIPINARLSKAAVSFSFDDLGSGYDMILGYDDNRFVCYKDTDGGFYVNFVPNEIPNWSTKKTLSVGADYVCEFGVTGATLNGSSILTQSKSSINIDKVYIFAHRFASNEVLRTLSHAKIYYVRLYDGDGALIYELTPAVDSEGKPCFYDGISESCIYPENEGFECG